MPEPPQTRSRKNRRYRPLMIVGTASEVGKSFICTGILRYLSQEGFYPAPFKAQNMSLNSYATPEGGEMGRAQAIQAEACGLKGHTNMNPILLKPQNEQESQLILHGNLVGKRQAKSYFLGEDKDLLFEEAYKAFTQLQNSYEPIVIEGAGSISELNLKHKDITNLRMALATQADVYLIADIDRGGVFGSLYGTLELLSPEEKTSIKGIIINKFRGDPQLFSAARTQIEDLVQKPIMGILPYNPDLRIPEEDSVSLETKSFRPRKNKKNIGIVMFRYLSNYTDFHPLEQLEDIHIFYSDNPKDLEQVDILILPGTKNTMQEMLWMRQNGVASVILQAWKTGKTVIGICGGYQLMGRSLHDPHHVEGNIHTLPGLGIFPTQTSLERIKQVGQKIFKFRKDPRPCTGYEIHMGNTKILPDHPVSPAVWMDDLPHGYSQGSAWGCYLHGIFENEAVVKHLLQGRKKIPSYAQEKENKYDQLAHMLSQHLPLKKMISQLEENTDPIPNPL
ncbi:MAG: cobyric acid synthase [Cytophagales bacterium]|nr:cobyric acid synthase [Cytophagales bacterium]